MILKRGAKEDLAATRKWMEESLRLAREQDRPRVLRLLGAVVVEVELEGTLLALPVGAHLAYERRQSPVRVPSPPDGPCAAQADSGWPAESGDGPDAGQEQEDLLAQRRARESARRRLEEEKRVQQAAAWEVFLRSEQHELELRKEGRLARLLGEPLPGESPEVLERLASEDRRQAREGLVALMSGGKMSYKLLDELSADDMPSRVAAERMRTGWLKDRRDAWLARSSPEQPID